MLVAVIDTHAIIWHLASDSRLSQTASAFINQTAQQANTIGLSSISLIEMVYLIEKGKIPAQNFTTLVQALDARQSVFTAIPVDLKVARAMTQVDSFQIPDMPDRIIAATAVLYQVPVISRDGKIKHSNIKTIW